MSTAKSMNHILIILTTRPIKNWVVNEWQLYLCICRMLTRVGKRFFLIQRQIKGHDWSDCAKEGYAVKPRKGDALLFFSLHPDANTDPSCLHGSCPVIEGEKWSATKWIHVRSFGSPARSTSGDCVDENPNCASWALQGECEKNPYNMMGSKEGAGYCRKSCKVCSSKRT